MPWRSYDQSSIVANLAGALWFNISKYNLLDAVTKHCFFTYTTLLALHALVLRRIARSSAYERWRHPLTAFTRLATVAACRHGLQGWTMPSQNCTADLFRYVLFRQGILTQIFMTIYFPLPGVYHQVVHITTTVWFVKNSSKVCSILLDNPNDPCDYKSWLTGVLWRRVSVVGQTLAGIMYAQVDEQHLQSLDIQGQCHVSMVWLQLCLGYLLPCLLQFTFGFDKSLNGYLDELPAPNRYCVFLAQLMVIMGLFWRVSYTWGLSLLDAVVNPEGQQCPSVGS